MSQEATEKPIRRYQVAPAQMRSFQATAQADPNCTYDGDLTSGRLQFGLLVGEVVLSYRYDGEKLLTVTLERFPGFVSAGWLFNEIARTLGCGAAEKERS